jgi:hypothetical protein
MNTRSGARALPAILWGGGVAGALDISYAIMMGRLAGGNAVRTLQSVASGLLGRGAFQGGGPTAALGLGLHFFIALSFAAVYFGASRRMTLLVERAWLTGPLFGALVYVFMNLVVVPLSAAPFSLPLRISGFLIHMLGVGLPIALAVRHYAPCAVEREVKKLKE